MVSPGEVRRLALELPEAVEADHHGMPSFRVRGRIFATLPDGSTLRAMLDEGGIRTAVNDEPEACSELWWGKRLAAVAVDLRVADAALAARLLEEAHERRYAGARQGARRRRTGGSSSS
jgi:hypothetical protein